MRSPPNKARTGSTQQLLSLVQPDWTNRHWQSHACVIALLCTADTWSHTVFDNPIETVSAHIEPYLDKLALFDRLVGAGASATQVSSERRGEVTEAPGAFHVMTVGFSRLDNSFSLESWSATCNDKAECARFHQLCWLSMSLRCMSGVSLLLVGWMDGLDTDLHDSQPTTKTTGLSFRFSAMSGL